MVNVLFLLSKHRFVTSASGRQISAFVSSANRRHSSLVVSRPRTSCHSRQPLYSSTEACRRIVRFASTSNDENQDEPTEKKTKSKKNKLKVKEITPENIDKLAAAFDEMARKEGFDSSMSQMTDSDTFEDFFDDDDDEDIIYDDDDDADLDGDDEEAAMGLDDILDASNFDLSDFEEQEEGEVPRKEKRVRKPRMEVKVDEGDDDFLDFGGGDDDDMDARIAAAKRDMASGQVTVPKQLDRFAQGAAEADLKELGFKRELNPFGNDETPRREQFKLITNAKTCSACGSDFQSRDEQKPGYLPPEKFEIQTKLARIEEMQQLQGKAESAEWSVDDEIEYLIQTSRGDSPGSSDPQDATNIDIDAIAEEMGLDLAELAKKKVICKRCHGLQNFGTVDEALRPGWTDEPTMSQEKFKNLLKPISEKPAVIIALVDLFDFGGSVLRELDGIAGDNPVILAANKVDLLPASMGKTRAENWVRRELEYMGVKSLANVGGAVRLISCKSGLGVQDLLTKARGLADEMDCDVYVVGAANAGKSTFINNILGLEKDKQIGKVRAGNRNAVKGALTTSPLPGTTLKFIKVDIGDGKSLYDTPGLLVPGTITQLLTPEELKIVCPKK
jgi:hypothetical protein